MEIKDLKQHIKELMAAMGRTGMKRLTIKHDDFELELERSETPCEMPRAMEPAEKHVITHDGPGKPLPHSTSPIPHEHSSPTHHQEKSHPSDGSTFITSPMVGTFYSSASPEAPTFVKVGDTVAKDDVVCIIEAMKVMNEIKAGASGSIVEILVSNGDPVEFGTKLFRVR
ncbi:MAG: acetyl-CoA carboxylase biotin carboxyl carrier protein [Parachlamydiales bacterium]